jgi:ribosomal protein S27E
MSRMTMAREFEALRGDEFRIMCPNCQTMWSTLSVPSECDTCGTIVTFRALNKPTKREDEQNGDNNGKR